MHRCGVNWILRNMDFAKLQNKKKIWILQNKKNLDFAKSTFFTTFIKIGFCEMKKKYLDFAK